MADLEPCPGCGARLPRSDGPTHRYIGASAACWAIFTALNNAGEPPLAPSPTNALIADAYAAQHPGTPLPQAIQSVAVHLLTLQGVLERGVSVEQALWLRQRVLNERSGMRQGRFQWLAAPDFAGTPTVADIVQAPTPRSRTEQAARYVQAVWKAWSQAHGKVLRAWYDQYAGGT